MVSTRAPRGLYAVCDDTVRPELPLVEKGRAVLAGGAKVLQLRMKRTPLREGVEVARALVRLCRAEGATLIVNDRVDLALLSGADGVHLGEDDLLPADARAVLGDQAIIGVTTRNLADLQAAHAAGATYAGIGPVFVTRTKTVNAPAIGCEALAKLAAHSPLPLVAISGIGLGNIREVGATGVHSAAVVSDLLLADDIPARARALQAAFEEGCATLAPPR